MPLLVDTNVHVYALDESEPVKMRCALALQGALQANGAGTISTQVVGEYYNSLAMRVRPPLSREAARSAARDLADAWPPLAITAQIVEEALRGAARYQLNYWDAQLWATALVNRIPIVLSEDFEDGRVLEGVTFVDPFVDGFDLEALLADLP